MGLILLVLVIVALGAVVLVAGRRNKVRDLARAGDSITQPADIRHVTEIIEDGRYAIACVRARVAGAALPTRRPPCFFDPCHGLSVADVPTSRRAAWSGTCLPAPLMPSAFERAPILMSAR